MSWLTEDQIALIDQRIAVSRARDRAIGSIVSRDTTGPGAQVVFDGSTVAVPVKCVGNVFCQPGDRVLLDRYGTEWIITNAFSSLALGEASVNTFGPAVTVTLTSTTYVDMVDVPAATFTKFFDGSFIRFQFNAQQFVTNTVTRVQYALRLTATSGADGYTATDYPMNFYAAATGSTFIHFGTTATGRITGVPAGQFSVQARWKRISGSVGNVQYNDDDIVSFELDERVAANAAHL